MPEFNPTKLDTETATESRNYAGGRSYDPASPELGLYTVVVNNMLESTYYREDWESVEQVWRAFDAAANADREFVLQLAALARNELGNRDVAVLLYVLAANDERYATTDPDDTLCREYGPRVLARMDEPATALAMHDELFDRAAPQPLKKGAADAIAALLGEDYETGAYRLGKYQRSSREVTLRDTVNRVHVRAYANIEDGTHRDRLLTQLMEGDLDEYDAEPLDPPGTWENVISERGNTADAWRAALDGDVPGVSRGMGIMARVRNVRNMLEAGLDGEEIFGEAELERVERSRMFPFRLFTAYRAYRAAAVQDHHVEEFLETAIQRLVRNVPDTWGDTAVGIDLSGSMQRHAVSDGSVVTAADIACFFGGIAMNKGAHAAAFGRDMEVLDDVHVDTPALEIMSYLQRDVQARIDTGGTNAWLFMRHLSDLDREFDRVVFLTDMQAWDTTRFAGGGGSEEQTVKRWIDDYREDPSDLAVYLLDLSSYGDLLTPEGYPNVYNVSGWNESILEFVEYAEEPGEMLDQIREY